jgi:hypothetical protein
MDPEPTVTEPEDPFLFKRTAAFEKFIFMGSRSGKNFLLNRALLAFYGPLGVEANYVFYNALSVAEGAHSWPHLAGPTFNPGLAIRAEVAVDIIAPLAAAAQRGHAVVEVSADGYLSVDLRDPTRSPEAIELARIMDEEGFEQKLKKASETVGVCFRGYMATAVAILASPESPIEALDEFLFAEDRFIARVEAIFFQEPAER